MASRYLEALAARPELFAGAVLYEAPVATGPPDPAASAALTLASRDHLAYRKATAEVAMPVSLLRNRRLRLPDPHLVMRPGDRIALLAQTPS